jgi:C-terminal processing protease CtpA/Prc
MLSRFTVIFDFPNEKMYLKKNNSFKKKFYYNLSGLTLRATGLQLKEYEISNVRENTTAYRAEIIRGDKIISVNGLEVKLYDLNNVNNLLNSRPGKKIRLELLRNGQPIKKEFILESQI